MQVKNFTDFCSTLLASGFSLGGGNAKGIYAVIPYDWTEQELIDTPVRWHTGDPETDPWEWRMRVLEERKDIAYSKVFFRASGYITAQWYPFFLAVRRNGETFEDAYAKGTIGRTAKRIYDVISSSGTAALHEIKSLGGFQHEGKTDFESGMVELQMRMFITMCGRAQKRNQFGEGYGWSSTVFTTTEEFWKQRGVTLPDMDPDAAYRRIEEQVISLNPEANAKRISRFIRG